jgi:hypothetical protein
MRWSILVSFGTTGILGLLLAHSVLADGPPAPKQGIVQIDVNKLPPEVAKRLLDELAKQKKPAVAAADKSKPEEKPSKGKGAEKPSKGKKPGDKPAKGGEKPSKGKGEPAKPPEKKEPAKK